MCHQRPGGELGGDGLGSDTMAKAWLCPFPCKVVSHWRRWVLSFYSFLSCGSRCIPLATVKKAAKRGQRWKIFCVLQTFCVLHSYFIAILRQKLWMPFPRDSMFALLWVVRGEIPDTLQSSCWSTTLLYFCCFFWILVLLPTVTLVWFSTPSPSRISRSRCLVSRQVFRQVLYCWVSRNRGVAEDLWGCFPKPLLPGWAMLQLFQKSV